MKKSLKNNLKISGSNWFWISKRIFDILFSLFLFPIMIVLIIVLCFLNPAFNKGTIFFIQTRMGKDCKPFKAIKFRSMKHSNITNRKYDDPIEVERITILGKFIRQTRLDEIPQILNVLKGDMSLIGPRPDYYEHAVHFIDSVDNYKLRHVIRPGLSGLSQIRLGYAEGVEATKRKTVTDIYYIENTGFLLDIKIIFGTIFTIIRSAGI